MKIKTEKNEYDLQDSSIIKLLPDNPTDADIANAILNKQQPVKGEPIFESGAYNYTVLGHFKKDNLVYNLMLEKDNIVQSIPMKSEFYTKTERGEQSLHTPCEGKNACGDHSGESRLYSTSDKITVNKNWMNFEGRTLDNEYYKKLYSGTVIVKDGISTEMNMSGDLTGRWLMRKIPNVFDKNGKDSTLLWKPRKDNEYKLFNERNTSEQSFQVLQQGNIVTGTILAEGTWEGKKKVTWNRESVKGYYDQLINKMKTEDYKIPLNYEHDSKNIVGHLDKIDFSNSAGLARILAKGYTTLSPNEYKGLSIHFEYNNFYKIEGYDTDFIKPDDKINFDYFQVALTQNPACTLCRTR